LLERQYHFSGIWAARMAILSYANERVRSRLTGQIDWTQKNLTQVVFAQQEVVVTKEGVGMSLA